MPEMIRRRQQRQLVALAAALSLGAAACGGDASTAAPDLAAEDTTADAPASTGSDAETTAPAVSSSDGSAAEGQPSQSDSSAAEPTENLFPDIDVVNIADSSTVNLAAELGGGDQPVLLWFWAPH